MQDEWLGKYDACRWGIHKEYSGSDYWNAKEKETQAYFNG